MWGSNAFRLRRGLSAVQHGRHSRWYSSSTEPVNDKEFLEAFEKVHPRHKWRSQYTVGLAISGGVDSMALATLYSKALQMNQDLPKCHGIIIDHKARQGSTEEAEWVAEQLRWKLNMASTIVPLTWPEEVQTLQLSRFESEARRLRYQALGLACRDYEECRITSLLVAHHGDDQAETVMMRLINRRWRSGLQGMQSVEWIPECYGIYGVHHSGGIKVTPGRPKSDFHLPYLIEKGGIRVLRPLLTFEKSRLIATCKEYGTAWVEDKTNQDPTLTSRNAIRHITQNSKLPEALSRPVLSQLAQTMQDRIKSHKEVAENVFNNCLIKLDIQTASLVVRFPPSSSFLDRPVATESDKKQARNVAYFFLQRLTEMISPKEIPSTGQLSKAIDYLYPNLCEEWEPQTMQTFCVFGVWFRPWEKPTPFAAPDALPAVDPMEYLLCRQPLDDHERRCGLSLTIPPSSSDTAATWQWQLFDGRFWLRIRNHTQDEMIVRMLEPADTAKVAESTKHTPLLTWRPPDRFLKAALNLIKPADIRHTIPGIFRKNRESGSRESLIALPTLGVSLADRNVSFSTEVCQWSIRYRKIDTGRRAAEEIVAPAISMDAIKQEISRIDNDLKMKQQAKQQLLKQYERSGEESDAPELPFRTVRLKQRVERKREKRDEDRTRKHEGGYRYQVFQPDAGGGNFQAFKRLRVGDEGAQRARRHRKA